MSKTNQSKKYADPTTENKKIESGKAENNRTEKNKTGKKEYFNTITSDPAHQVRYCPTCDFVPGTDTWYAPADKC